MTSVFKNSLLILCLSAAALCCFISCDKDKDEKPKTKRELLQQKWNLIVRYDTSQSAPMLGPNFYTVYTGKPGDYFEFRKDDTLVQSVDGSVNKRYYRFNDSTMTVKDLNGNTIYRIWDLTDSTLEVYFWLFMNNRGDAYISNHAYLKR